MTPRPEIPGRAARLKPLILVPVALAALASASCSSDDSSNADDSTAPAAASTTTCPTSVPAASTPADWTLKGVSGSVNVVAPTADRAPSITVTEPFAVDETVVKTLTPGTGADVHSDSMVTVCYEGVDGKTGDVFDNAFERGRPAQFSPAEVVPGFSQALVGQKVGASVAVAMTPADGYGPSGNPDAKIGAPTRWSSR